MNRKGTMSWGMTAAAMCTLGICVGSLVPAQSAAAHDPAPAEIRKAKRAHQNQEVSEARRIVAASIHRARSVARLMQQAMIEIAEKPKGLEVEASDFTALKEQLIDMERFIDDLTKGASKEKVAYLGYDTLRRTVAEARSSASGAEMLAWQSSKNPITAEARISEEGLRDLANRFETERERRQLIV